METKKFLSLENFFSLSEIPFKELFLPKEFAWYPLFQLQNFFKSQQLGKIEITIPASVHIENPELVSIGKGTVIEPGVYIKGPCILGKNCTVRHGAYIREHVLAFDNAMIGHDTEIKHSILLPHASAAHFAYIGDSILGSHVNLGAGVKCANFRLDKKKVPIFYEGKKIETELLKMGAIVGDGVQIGCNCVLNPGTLIGKKSLCYPLLSLQGVIPANSVLKVSSN